MLGLSFYGDVVVRGSTDTLPEDDAWSITTRLHFLSDMERQYDVLAMGRSLMDLYAVDVGVPFTAVKTFAAYVGGCPTNLGVGARRLGLRTALLTAFGDDLAGDFVLDFLSRERVDVRFARRKPGYRTSAVLLAMDPANGFPLVAYRDSCADLELTIDDVLASPVADSRVLFITGTGLSREPSRSATLFAAEWARRAGTRVFLDLDYRAAYWQDAYTFSTIVREALPLVDVAIGNGDEVSAAVFAERRTTKSPERTRRIARTLT